MSSGKQPQAAYADHAANFRDLVFKRLSDMMACQHRAANQVQATMPLLRRKPEFVSTLNGVEFLMHDGEREVTCCATRDLLRNRFGSKDRAGDEHAFSENRHAIESIASSKYEAGKTEAGADPKILITEWDMASPLSLKL
jgi:Protein of unknown function (DUF1488)